MRAIKPGGRRHRYFRCIECGEEQRAQPGKSMDAGMSGRCNKCLRKGMTRDTGGNILRANYPCCGKPLREDWMPKTARRPGFRCRACKAADKEMGANVNLKVEDSAKHSQVTVLQAAFNEHLGYAVSDSVTEARSIGSSRALIVESRS